MSKASKPRTIILTVGVAATAVTGAWYGAGLKTRQDIKKVQVFLRSASLRLPSSLYSLSL